MSRRAHEIGWCKTHCAASLSLEQAHRWPTEPLTILVTYMMHSPSARLARRRACAHGEICPCCGTATEENYRNGQGVYGNRENDTTGRGTGGGCWLILIWRTKTRLMASSRATQKLTGAPEGG